MKIEYTQDLGVRAPRGQGRAFGKAEAARINAADAAVGDDPTRPYVVMHKTEVDLITQLHIAAIADGRDLDDAVVRISYGYPREHAPASKHWRVADVDRIVGLAEWPDGKQVLGIVRDDCFLKMHKPRVRSKSIMQYRSIVSD